MTAFDREYGRRVAAHLAGRNAYLATPNLHDVTELLVAYPEVFEIAPDGFDDDPAVWEYIHGLLSQHRIVMGRIHAKCFGRNFAAVEDE